MTSFDESMSRYDTASRKPGVGRRVVCGLLLLSAKTAYGAECATDGSDASVSVTSSTTNGVDVWKIAASGYVME